jgi:hypothetical protein
LSWLVGLFVCWRHEANSLGRCMCVTASATLTASISRHYSVIYLVPACSSSSARAVGQTTYQASTLLNSNSPEPSFGDPWWCLPLPGSLASPQTYIEVLFELGRSPLAASLASYHPVPGVYLHTCVLRIRSTIPEPLSLPPRSGLHDILSRGFRKIAVALFLSLVRSYSASRCQTRAASRSQPIVHHESHDPAPR